MHARPEKGQLSKAAPLLLLAIYLLHDSFPLHVGLPYESEAGAAPEPLSQICLLYGSLPLQIYPPHKSLLSQIYLLYESLAEAATLQLLSHTPVRIQAD
jgi:hypothetical protein